MSLSAEFDKRIVIQQRPAALNQYNEQVEDWIAFAEVWASITDLTGREFVAAGGTQNAVSTKIKIRHLNGIEDHMRVVHGTDVYAIEARLGQAGRTILLMCSRGVKNG